jgi:hypothetical protein
LAKASRIGSEIFMPPNLAFQASQLGSLNPCFLHSSLLGSPASASLKNPMICSSLNRFFLSDRLLGLIEL